MGLEIPTAPALNNAVAAAPSTAAGIAEAGVSAVKGFIGPLVGPALGLALAYWGIKTIIGQPPQIIKNLVGQS